MPRPRQRRGADAKRAEKLAKAAEREAEQARVQREMHTASTMPWSTLPSTEGGPHGGQEGSDDVLPQVDPDTKAYFLEVSNRIDELAALGHGTAQEDEEEAVDERPILLRRALESLAGHELALAADQETSVVLERLLPAMDDFARRVVVDKLTGSYKDALEGRFSGHVIQAMWREAQAVVDRETRGIIAEAPDQLPTMTDLILRTVAEILPFIPSFLYNSYASPCLRTLLQLLSGTTTSPQDNDAESRTKSKAGRSKKSRQWRAAQTTSFDRNFLEADARGARPVARDIATPPSFGDAYQKVSSALSESLAPAELRRAAMDAIGGPLVRVIVETEARSEGGWTEGGWLDRLTCGLVSLNGNGKGKAKGDDPREEERDEFLTSLLRSPAGAPTFESLLTIAPPAIFKALWTLHFASKMARVAGSAVANYVVAIGIARLDAEDFANAVEEIEGIALERRKEWVDNRRLGVFKAMLDRSRELDSLAERVADLIRISFGVENGDEEAAKELVTCILTAQRWEFFSKLNRTSLPLTTPGSLLLQSWLSLPSSASSPLIASLQYLATTSDLFLPIAIDPSGSRVIDSLLMSPSLSPLKRRDFVRAIAPYYHTLAADRLGSRVAEKIWETSDVFLKETLLRAIQEGGAERDREMMGGQFSRFVHRRMEGQLWKRDRESWKERMLEQSRVAKERASLVNTPAVKSQVQPPGLAPAKGEKKRKREKQIDEMDEIFAKAGQSDKRRRKESPDEDEPSIASDVPRASGLEEVLGA